jgi:hypothetical protein
MRAMAAGVKIARQGPAAPRPNFRDIADNPQAVVKPIFIGSGEDRAWHPTRSSVMSSVRVETAPLPRVLIPLLAGLLLGGLLIGSPKACETSRPAAAPIVGQG